MKQLKYRLLTIITFLFFSFEIFAQNGKINGRVYDALNNEPMPFVNVVINGTTIGAITDLDGNFLITGLEPAIVRLSVSFVGYKPLLSNELKVSNTTQAYIELALEQADQTVDEVVVRASPFRRTEESPVSLQSIGLSEIEDNPGANRDISRVIQSFPGVGSTASFRNDILIRGGGPNESRFFLDGMEIPNINHFATQGASGGPAGILNADFISSVDFYSGAFPAKRGNAMSAVFEFSQMDGNTQDVRFRGAVGASELSLTLDGPIGEKTSFIVSARQSYLQFLFSALQLPFLPTFNDYQMKTRTRINEHNEITFVSIGALDKSELNTGLENPDREQQYILDYLTVQNQWNYAIGGIYKHFSENSYQTVVLSRNMLNNVAYKHYDNNEALPRKFDYGSQEIENKLRIENTSRRNDFKMNYGVSAEFAKYNNSTYQQIFTGGELLEVDYSSEFNMLKWAAFGQVSHNFFNTRLSISLGARADANNYSEEMQNPLNQFSPRFSAAYFLTQEFSVNFNMGRYFQLPSYTTFGYRNAEGELVNKNNSLKYIRADHLIAGVEYRPQSNLKFSLEAFYKEYSNYPFSVRDSICLANKGADFGVVGDEEVLSIGEGRAIGAELLMRGKFDKITSIMAFTLVSSEFKDKNGNFIPSSWDGKFIVSLTNSFDFGKNWSLGFKWRFVGGLPYTPYNMEVSALKLAWDSQGRAFLDYNKLNTERLNAFHQLDLRIDKDWYFKNWSLKLYFDIQNAYNYQSGSAPSVLLALDENNTPIIENPDAPLQEQKYRLETLSATSGTVLPTIGIMFEF